MLGELMGDEFTKILRKIKHVCFIVGLCFLAPLSPVQAKYASFVMDAETGRVLYQKNADTLNYPASLTKMMTLYMLFDALERGKLTMNKQLATSANATRQPPSKLGLRLGETITVRDAILSLATKSANDVAVVIAEEIGRTERRFAVAMTAKARKIGMQKTTFRNASGLPHRGQLSTARDMAKLARHLISDFPQYYKFFSRRTFKYDGKTYKNHNKLLKTYRGVDGIKTGYIRASGFNLVTSAEREGNRIIGVVFGGRTSRSRNHLMTKLLNNGFKKLENGIYANGSPKNIKKKKPKPSQRYAQGRLETITPQHNRSIIWGVQVGAYRQYGQAYKRATSVYNKVLGYLKNGTIEVSELTKRNRGTLYRARITGISKRQAYRTCQALERRQIDCMEFSRKIPMLPEVTNTAPSSS
jgi:D-alanyl-D-alanine carboxypeptidase